MSARCSEACPGGLRVVWLGEGQEGNGWRRWRPHSTSIWLASQQRYYFPTFVAIEWPLGRTVREETWPSGQCCAVLGWPGGPGWGSLEELAPRSAASPPPPALTVSFLLLRGLLQQTGPASWSGPPVSSLGAPGPSANHGGLPELSPLTPVPGSVPSRSLWTFPDCRLCAGPLSPLCFCYPCGFSPWRPSCPTGGHSGCWALTRSSPEGADGSGCRGPRLPQVKRQFRFQPHRGLWAGSGPEWGSRAPPSSPTLGKAGSSLQPAGGSRPHLGPH